MGESVLIAQLAREPVPGRVKTRLLPALGPERAAKLHAEMVCWTCRTLIDAGLGPVQLWVEGNAARAPFRTCVQWGAQGPLVQTGRDLGERMAHICVRGLAEHDAIILVGSDAPGIDRDFLVEARAALRRVDVAVGPALDGGYVLLGLRRYSRRLFRGIDWGGDRVLRQTLEAIASLGWSHRVLEARPDIDRPEDLRYLPEALRSALEVPWQPVGLGGS